MAGLGNTYENGALDAIFNATALAITTVYASLHNGDPADTGANEITGGSYARQSTSWTAAAARALETDAAVQWTGMPEYLTGGSGPITYLGLFDALTVGNLVGAASIGPLEVPSGGQVDIATGDIDVSLPSKLGTTAAHGVLDALFNNTSYSEAAVWVSLHNADPGGTGASEITGGSYARQSLSCGAAASGALDNDTVIDFTGMPAYLTGGSGPITHFGVWDAVSAGNFLWGDALDANEEVSSGATFRFPVGDLNFTWD